MLLGPLPEAIEALRLMPYGLVLAAAVLGLATTLLVGCSVPGTLVPLSFTSGLLLGTGGIVVVALGAVAGSHILFTLSRGTLADRIKVRLGPRLQPVEQHLARGGAMYVVGARITGVPHLVVTLASALAGMSARTFASASLLGMLPAIGLAASAGAAL